MSASKDALLATANRLRKQIAATEATLSGLRLKLAKAEAGLTGQAVPVSGLDVLWKTALAIGRNRSSKQQCRMAWNQIPKGERPPIEKLIDALKIWNRSDEWRKDGYSFVPGLHRWIKNRCWEDLPEVEEARSRTPKAPRSVTPADPSTAATPEEIAEILGVLKPKRMNS